MSDSRILILDANAMRAQQISTILTFLDMTPIVIDDTTSIALDGPAPISYGAVVVGDIESSPESHAFLAAMGQRARHPLVIALSGSRGSEEWTNLIKPGRVATLDYPIKRSDLSAALRVASLHQLEDDRESTSYRGGPTGTSLAARLLNQLIDQVAVHDSTVLIMGESGAGKEVCARAIHERSRRRDMPFIAINCGAIPPDALESELFGHEIHPHSGPRVLREGKLDMAEDGTLLLDEVGDMSLPMQVKLLRVLQEKSFNRVGSASPIQCNVRILAATHRNLEQAIEDGTFRMDLFYRLNVVPMEIPPLRERADDLPCLVDDISKKLARSGQSVPRLDMTAIAALQSYAWPGNIRELSNLLERMAVIRPNGTVSSADLPSKYRAGSSSMAQGDHFGRAPQVLAVSGNMAMPTEGSRPVGSIPSDDEALQLSFRVPLPPEGLDLRQALRDIEIGLIRDAMYQANAVTARAAALLGLGRTTLVEKLKRLKLAGGMDLSE
ncbi:sigma-54 dependent transcriptional regulator [Stenotrophomonas pavanii]|uniref:sigma-54 dependent transcriptional regulator n=1 Tax=Stenotrophomonas pavanii TaxID=487698 RepID=UPI002DBBEF70|nr:sigma-54 dependent transcriptional regulator [Stenotrophomonas pavanii]MEC4339734.1 sigma-54 dependent transcriptional regulator [Stenotrophomonas pavanii]